MNIKINLWPKISFLINSHSALAHQAVVPVPCYFPFRQCRRLLPSGSHWWSPSTMSQNFHHRPRAHPQIPPRPRRCFLRPFLAVTLCHPILALPPMMRTCCWHFVVEWIGRLLCHSVLPIFENVVPHPRSLPK